MRCARGEPHEFQSPLPVRALYEWIVDNDCTPHLLVNADYAEVRVPPGYANDGQIVLNASPVPCATCTWTTRR